MPRRKPEEIVAPAAFAPQPPLASPEARAYAEAASAATREEAERGFAPLRAAYGPDIQHRLDVYPAPDKGRPVLLFFHGGAWITGYLWWCGFMARAVQQAGAMLVAGTYRLAPTERFPAQLEDVKAALAWVRGTSAPTAAIRRASCSRDTRPVGISPRWRRSTTTSRASSAASP